MRLAALPCSGLGTDRPYSTASRPRTRRYATGRTGAARRAVLAIRAPRWRSGNLDCHGLVLAQAVAESLARRRRRDGRALDSTTPRTGAARTPMSRAARLSGSPVPPARARQQSPGRSREPDPDGPRADAQRARDRTPTRGTPWGEARLRPRPRLDHPPVCSPCRAWTARPPTGCLSPDLMEALAIRRRTGHSQHSWRQALAPREDEPPGLRSRCAVLAQDIGDRCLKT